MRNIKILGLMLAAMFAMSAVAATAASADEFTSEVAPVTLTGTSESGFTDEFTTTAGVVKCPKATYKGTQATVSTTTATVTPDYEDQPCTGFGFPATIDVNECQYVFHINGGTSTEGTVDVECPAGKEITITATSAGTEKCTVHVPTQTSIPGTVKFSGIGSGTTREITVDVNLTGVKYTHTKGTGIGACTAGSASNGTMKAKATVTGESGSTHVGLFLSNV